MGAEAGSARLQCALSSQVLQVLDYISGLNPERGLSQGDVAIWNVATTVLPTKYKRTIALLQ